MDDRTKFIFSLFQATAGRALQKYIRDLGSRPKPFQINDENKTNLAQT
jgi:hypothetical protein